MLCVDGRKVNRPSLSISLSLSLDLCLREDSGSDFRFSFRFLEKKSPPRFAKRRRNRGAMFARALSSSGYFGGTPCAEIGRAGRCKFEKLKGNTRVWKKRSVLEAFKAFRALLESFFFYKTTHSSSIEFPRYNN